VFTFIFIKYRVTAFVSSEVLPHVSVTKVITIVAVARDNYVHASAWISIKFFAVFFSVAPV